VLYYIFVHTITTETGELTLETAVY